METITGGFTPNIFQTNPKKNSFILNKSADIKAQNDLSTKTVRNNTNNHTKFIINYNNADSRFEGRVIDMNAKIQEEIDRILRTQRNIYMGLFILSIIIVFISWIPFILSKEVSIVLKPLSLSFTSMIVLHYCLGRAK